MWQDRSDLAVRETSLVTSGCEQKKSFCRKGRRQAYLQLHEPQDRNIYPPLITRSPRCRTSRKYFI